MTDQRPQIIQFFLPRGGPRGFAPSRIVAPARVWALAWLVASGVLAPAGMAQTRPATAAITVDGAGPGRVFGGLGAVSASSSRLLFDYPEPQRSELLDYLFKPGYGAALQILKVEIGGDMNSTDCAEPSHMRTRDDLNFDRGFEWWLMKEARARNPEIALAGLQWGAPGWFEGGFWSRDNIDYILKWLEGARRHGLTIQYLGGWNESGFEPSWFVELDRALKSAAPEVKIIAADDLPHHNWRVAAAMLADPAFLDAVDVLGQHSPGGWRSLYQHYSSTPEARSIGKPLWASEQSALSHDVGGGPWARGINRAYIDARITSSMAWAPVSAWYPHLPHADTGLILAQWPWSGYYCIGSIVWVYAHTTQFTRPGWQYIDSACGYLDTGASYVTLKAPEASPAGRHYSIIIETMNATGPSDVRFMIAGGLAAGPVHVWSSHIASATPADDFIHERVVEPVDSAFSVTLEPGHVYTLSTTSGQSRGGARPPSNVFEQMALPFVEDFESYAPGKLARYFLDLNGGFETAPAGGGREGMVYRQMVTRQPIAWNLAGAGGMPPTTIFGDPRWWGDYELSADALLEQDGYIECIGRIAAQAGQKIAGYHLQIHSNGTWRLYSQDLSGVRPDDEEIASGAAPFPVGRWHTVALRMKGSEISFLLNGKVVGAVNDARHVSGNVGLRVSGWQNAQFDNVRVTPTAPVPRFMPQDKMTVSATSEHPFFYRGDVYPARYAIDGRPESIWHTRFNPRAPLPQSLTLDLGDVHEVEGLTCQPRLDNSANGMITRYNVYLSVDGKEFVRVVDGGQWPVSTATKIASWPARPARYVRLEATRAVGGNMTTAGEINVRLGRSARPGE